MVNPIAWIDAKRDLTYAEAQALAASLGGRLLIFDYDPAVFTTLRDYMNKEEDSVWLDASSTPRIPEDTARQLLVEYLSPAPVLGPSGDDRFMGGPFAGRVLRAGDGNDSYMGGDGGGTIDMGRGDDEVFLGTAGDGVPWANNSPTPGTIIIDGAGRDRIVAEGAVIKASLDGDADIFESAARVTYAAATTGLTIADGQVSGGGAGADTLGELVFEAVGGSGDDTISGVLRIQGGRGADTLTALAYASGGDGNDILIADSDQRVRLLGDNGDDEFIIRSTAEVTGGAGVDTYVFEAVAKTTINDLRAGESIDLSALLDVTVSEAFSGGYLKQAQKNGYTTLSIDVDGGGNGYVELASLKGAYNLADYILI